MNYKRLCKQLIQKIRQLEEELDNYKYWHHYDGCPFSYLRDKYKNE